MAGSDTQKVKDPVCGMMVQPETAKHHLRHRSHDYYFCCAGCKTKFAADPEKYLAPEKPDAPANPDVPYTCPMHPEIRQMGPGSCPLCGMALEPLYASAQTGPNHELIDMTRRFWFGLALAVPVFLLEMSGHAGVPLAGPRTSLWLQFALTTPVVLWAGWPFFVRGWQSIVHRAPNMFTLISLGVAAAYGYSLVATFLPFLFPAALHRHGIVPVYYEAAAIITVLVLLGQMLELRAREKTGDAVRALLNLAPKTARRLNNGREDDIAIEQVRTGDLLRVRPGERVPVDGVVEDGESDVDESMVTGEAIPVGKNKGTALIGGTINGTGALVMRAEKVGADTMLARIVQLVSDAQRSRAPIQRLADKVASFFVPAVIAIAVLAFIGWMAAGPSPAFAYALVAAVSVLIIACPCALGLATPMSIMVGVGRGAQSGILIRNAETLERMEKMDTLVVDKTGTLTEGRPAVIDVAAEGWEETTLLGLIASLERASEHPLSAAILREAEMQGARLEDAANVQSHTGRGITGTVAGHNVAVGNSALMNQLGAENPLEAYAETLRRDGATAMFAAIDGIVAGVIAIADPIKETSAAALTQLRADGIRIVMLTGDSRTTAKAVAAKLGIEEVEAEATPEAKGAIVKRLRGEGRIVAMAGDGVNDAPALASADIGIAMGTGTDIAMESAGVTLVKGDLAAIARAHALSRAIMRNVRQNLFLAFVYNILGVPIAAGILFPVFGTLLSPAYAAAAMSLSSVSVIGNALRLQRAQV